MKYRCAWLTLITLVSLLLCAAVWVNAATTGIISGVVKNSDDNKPLSGVNIIVTGTTLTTVTDAKGFYVIINVPPGDYEVRAEMVGFAKKSVNGVQVTMDSSTTVNFELKQEAIVETAAVVTRSRSMIAPDMVNTMNQITAVQEEMTRTDPVSVHTVPGVLSTLPGVVVDTDGTGGSHIRGGRSDQVGYYIEGIPIVDPNTGFFSDNLFSTGVSKFQAYTGNYGAEYGNAVAGALNEVKKTGDQYSGLSLSMDAGNGAYSSGALDFGGGVPGKMTYYIGSVAQKNDVDGNSTINKMNYSDNVGKFVFPWKDDTLTVIAMQGSLKGDLDYDGFQRQRYEILGATLSHNYSAKSFLTIRPYYIYTTTDQNLADDPSYACTSNNWSSQKGLMLGYTSQLNSRQLLKTGGILLQSTNRYSYNNVAYDVYSYHSNVDTIQGSLYLQDEIKLLEKLTLLSGLRYEKIIYDRMGNHFVDGAGYTGTPVSNISEDVFSPRTGISYAPDSRTAWRASWGRYAKFVPAYFVQSIYKYPDDNEPYTPGLGITSPQKSTVAEISYEKQLGDSVAFRITPFLADYKNLGDYVSDNGIYRYMNVGTGKSRGVELYVRKKMSDNWQGWLSYTYQTVKASKAPAGLYSDDYYTSWDQRHTLALVTDYKIGKWSHTFRTDFGSGRGDRADYVAGQDRAKPYAIFTYGCNVELPKSLGAGNSLYFNVYNIFNKRQTMQYSWNWDGTDYARDVYSWIPERFISMGINKTY